MLYVWICSLAVNHVSKKYDSRYIFRSFDVLVGWFKNQAGLNFWHHVSILFIAICTRQRAHKFDDDDTLKIILSNYKPQINQCHIYFSRAFEAFLTPGRPLFHIIVNTCLMEAWPWCSRKITLRQSSFDEIKSLRLYSMSMPNNELNLLVLRPRFPRL